MALTFKQSKAIACTPNICDTVRCAAAVCTENQVLVKNGGMCGCCDLCVTTLDEGENCSALLFVGGGPPTVKCADGLQCVDGICKKS
nr:unnamed protein product [Callosobruchus chinensis]